LPQDTQAASTALDLPSLCALFTAGLTFRLLAALGITVYSFGEYANARGNNLFLSFIN